MGGLRGWGGGTGRTENKQTYNSWRWARRVRLYFAHGPSLKVHCVLPGTVPLKMYTAYCPI